MAFVIGLGSFVLIGHDIEGTQIRTGTISFEAGNSCFVSLFVQGLPHQICVGAREWMKGIRVSSCASYRPFMTPEL